MGSSGSVSRAYSQVAVRELIANALVHRDYSLSGQVRVAIEGTTLSVSSPGGFPDGITIDNLLTAPPQARNPLIADAFKRAGLVERTGRGVNRVYRYQLALGRPQPDYSRSTRAWVEAQVPAGAADRELAAFAAAAARDNNALNLQTLQVLHEVRAESRITSVRAGELLHLAAQQARSVLNGLAERGVARSPRRGQGTHLSPRRRALSADGRTSRVRPDSRLRLDSAGTDGADVRCRTRFHRTSRSGRSLSSRARSSITPSAQNG